MKRRMAIATLVLIMSCSFLSGCNSKTSETKSERQEYAKNAYQLGLIESLALMTMPPERALEVQNIIHQIMNEEISLEEQEKALKEVFDIVEEYIAKGNVDIKI